MIAGFLTFITWTLEIIPKDQNDETLEYAPFFVLADHRFVMMISFPYLFVLGVVFTCDCTALLVAIMRKKRLNLAKNQVTLTLSTSKSGHDLEKSNPLTLMGPPSPQNLSSPTNSLSLNDLKLSIRCLSLTTWYFISQISIFLPGILIFGCDFKDVSIQG